MKYRRISSPEISISIILILVCSASNGASYEDVSSSNETAFEIDPSFREGLLYRMEGNQHYKYERYEDAINSYGRALNLIKPEELRGEILVAMGHSHYELGRYNEAVECYDESLNITDFDDETEYLISTRSGFSCYKLGRYHDALNYYNNSLELNLDDGTKAIIWMNKGLVYHQLERYDDAIYSYNKSIELDLNDETKTASLNNRGLAMNETGRYDEAIASYDEALKLVDLNKSDSKNNSIIILNNKGIALKQLGRSAQAAMIRSRANELDMKPEIKFSIFMAFLLIYFTLASGGYLLYRRCKAPNTAVMLSANLLGFLAVIWIFSGLFDPSLLGQLLLVGLMMLLVGGILWSFLGLPSDPWRAQIILTLRDFERKRTSTTKMIKATGLGAAIGYLILASVFYYRINLDSEKAMAEFLGWALLLITLTSLFVALPPIMGVLLSENLDRDSRDMLQIVLFSYLGIIFFYILLILWSFEIGGFCLYNIGDVERSGGVSLNISPLFLGAAISLLLFAFLIPYLSGWMRAKRHSEMLLAREISWIDELLNVLEFPTPSLYVQKLEKVLSDIGEEKTAPCPDENKNGLRPPGEQNLLLIDPRLRYEGFLADLQDRIRENIEQFEELKRDEEKLMERAQIYAEAYRVRKDEIARSIDKERDIRPKLLIILIFILAPIMTQILSKLSIAITESLSRLVSGGVLT